MNVSIARLLSTMAINVQGNFPLPGIGGTIGKVRLPSQTQTVLIVISANVILLAWKYVQSVNYLERVPV